MMTDALVHLTGRASSVTLRYNVFIQGTHMRERVPSRRFSTDSKTY